MNVVFVVYSLLCIAPLLLVLMVSLTDQDTVARNGFSLFPEKITLYAYRYVLADSASVLRAYGVTVITTFVGTVCSLLMTAMYAYPLSRKGFRYRGFFSFFVYFTMLFNGGLIPWYLLYSKYLHMQNTLPILIVPYLVSAYNVLIIRTYFSSNVPDSVVESAKMDGASEFRTFFSMILPLSTPVLATIALFNALMYWNDWYLSLIYITKNSFVNVQFMMYRIMISIQNLITAAGQNPAMAAELAKVPDQTARMAMAIIGIGPIVLAYPFFQRYYVKGLTLGSVKG
jgi:putative aldouronate transport system permease protein